MGVCVDYECVVLAPFTPANLSRCAHCKQLLKPESHSPLWHHPLSYSPASMPPRSASSSFNSWLEIFRCYPSSLSSPSRTISCRPTALPTGKSLRLYSSSAEIHSLSRSQKVILKLLFDTRFFSPYYFPGWFRTRRSIREQSRSKSLYELFKWIYVSKHLNSYFNFKWWKSGLKISLPRKDMERIWRKG